MSSDNEMGIAGIVTGVNDQTLPPGMADLLYQRDCNVASSEAVGRQRGKKASKEELDERRRLRIEREGIDERLKQLREQVSVVFTMRPFKDAEGELENEDITCEAGGLVGQFIRTSVKAENLLVMRGELGEDRFMVTSLEKAYSAMSTPQATGQQADAEPEAVTEGAPEPSTGDGEQQPS